MDDVKLVKFFIVSFSSVFYIFVVVYYYLVNKDIE